MFWGKDKVPMSVRVDGKTVIITGCNTGIGKATAMDLAFRGARIIMACRDLTKAEAVADEIRKETGAIVVVHQLDLADFQSIRKFADTILETETKIDILINNAGIFFIPRSKTKDGFEMHFGTNYLGHFLLTILLLERLKESAPARIINVGSILYAVGKIHWDDINLDKSYNGLKAYCQSKLANLLFTRELAKRLKGTGVNAYVLHPGVVKTDIQRHIIPTSGVIYSMFDFIFPIFAKTPEEGAKTSIYCAIAEELNNKSGLYYSESKETTPFSKATDEEASKRLWDLSMELTGLKSN